MTDTNREDQSIFAGTLADVAVVAIEAPLSDAEDHSCDYYHTAYGRAATMAAENGNHAAGHVYRFLSRICSFDANYGNREAPYRPFGTIRGGRGYLPEDLTREDLDALRQIHMSAQDPTLKARMGDILWLRCKDHKVAATAVESYLASGRRLIVSKHRTEAINEFTRALQLATLLGKAKPLWQTTAATVEEVALSIPEDDTSFIASQLMHILLSAGAGHPDRFVGRAATRAEAAEAKGDHYKAEAYWDVEAEWRKATDDEAGARAARLNAAEAKVQQAEALLSKPQSGHLAAASLLVQAVDALRKAGAAPERVAQVKAKLLDYQKKSMGEMREIGCRVDLGSVVQNAEEYVTCDGFQEAVRRFALGYPLVDPAALRTKVLELAEKYPIANLFGATYVDCKGRAKARTKGILNVTEASRNADIEARMFQQAAEIDWDLRAQAYIEPCRLVIWNMHHPTADDITYLVQANPFIPPGHDTIHARGILAGFDGDYLMAALFLVPQIENSIRFVLEQQGVDISNLMADLTQPVKTLGPLLTEPATTDIFGLDTVFELKGLLIEKTGFDFRNQVAHGFVSAPDCHSIPAVNIWWLVLRLCVMGFLMTHAEDWEQEGEGHDRDESGQAGDKEHKETKTVARTKWWRCRCSAGNRFTKRLRERFFSIVTSRVTCSPG